VALVWHLADCKTGDTITDLPLRVSGTIERSVSTSTTLQVTLDVHDKRCPPDWDQVIDPMRVMLVPVDGEHPLGVAYVIDADSYGEPSGSLTLNSIESILDASNVRTHSFSEGVDDEADVVVTLLSDAIAPGWGFDIDVTPTGKSADHEYAFEEDRTVGSAINDLAKAAGGPEWTMRIRWADEKRNRFIKTIYVGPRIGATTPSVVVENHHLESRIRARSFARGNRAVHVIATGDGSGPDRPMSAPAVDVDAIAAGVPPWEVRIQTTAVDDPAQLNRIAVSGLQRRWSGVRTWDMSLALTKPGCPKVGRDFDAGDTITIESGPIQHDPAEWKGPARIIGWRASVDADGNLATVTPVFYEEPEEGTS
jgi:hypothetical protein